MRDGKDCDQCDLGLRPGGTFCDCSFGFVQSKAYQAERIGREGHRGPLSLEVIPVRYRGNSPQSLAGLFGTDPSKIAPLMWVMKWADMPWVEQKRQSLFFWGPVGAGKTSLSMLALKLAMKKGHRGYVIYYSEWVNHLGGLGFKSEAAEVDAMLTVPVLVIDDLGSQDRHNWKTGDLEPETAKRMDMIRLIINGRMNRENPTIVNTNLTPDMVGVQFGDRVQSRILEDFKIWQVNGADLRKSVGVNHG